MKYTWATATDIEDGKPCAWLHDLPGVSVINAGSEFAYSVTIEDLASAVTLQRTAQNLLKVLSSCMDTAREDSQGEDSSAPSSIPLRLKPLVIIAHGLSGIVVKQVNQLQVVTIIVLLVLNAIPNANAPAIDINPGSTPCASRTSIPFHHSANVPTGNFSRFYCSEL